MIGRILIRNFINFQRKSEKGGGGVRPRLRNIAVRRRGGWVLIKVDYGGGGGKINIMSGLRQNCAFSID